MPIHFCCVTPRQCQSVWTYLNSENEDSQQQQFPKVQHIIPQLTGPASDKAHYKEKLQAITIQKIGAILFTWTVPQKITEKKQHRASRSKSAKVVGNGIPPNCRLNFNDDKTWDFEVLYVQRSLYNWKSQLCHCPGCFMNMSVISHRRKFGSQTSDNMDRWKAEQGRGREKRKIRTEKIRRERVRRKKMQMREKVGKSRNTVFFHCVFPMIWGSGGSKSRLAKAAGAEPAGQMRDEKNTHRCGAKHIWKSKCTKHTRFGPLLEVAMSKKCTPMWREAHFQVKMYKTHHARTTFGGSDVEKVHAVVARSTFPSQKCKKLVVLNLFWR